VVRVAGGRSQVCIYDYNTKLKPEENYADTDIVLIFFSAKLAGNDSFDEATKRKFVKMKHTSASCDELVHTRIFYRHFSL